MAVAVGESDGEEGIGVGGEVDICGSSATKLAGSINAGKGVWVKSNEFIILFAIKSLVPNVLRWKLSSASLSMEANSYSV